MSTQAERTWTAQIVLSSEHAGLRPEFKRLESELLRVLARVDEPAEVRKYLDQLRAASVFWFVGYEALHGEK